MTKACNKLNTLHNKYVHIPCGPTHDQSCLWKKPSGIWSQMMKPAWEVHMKFLNKNTHVWVPDLTVFEDKITN